MAAHRHEQPPNESECAAIGADRGLRVPISCADIGLLCRTWNTIFFSMNRPVFWRPAKSHQQRFLDDLKFDPATPLDAIPVNPKLC